MSVGQRAGQSRFIENRLVGPLVVKTAALSISVHELVACRSMSQRLTIPDSWQGELRGTDLATFQVEVIVEPSPRCGRLRHE
jgi:hypothetical protein